MERSKYFDPSDPQDWQPEVVELPPVKPGEEPTSEYDRFDREDESIAS